MKLTGQRMRLRLGTGVGPVDVDELVLGLARNEDRHSGLSDHILGDRTEQEPLRAAASVRAEHQQVHVAAAGLQQRIHGMFLHHAGVERESRGGRPEHFVDVLREIGTGGTFLGGQLFHQRLGVGLSEIGRQLEALGMHDRQRRAVTARSHGGVFQRQRRQLAEVNCAKNMFRGEFHFVDCVGLVFGQR